jgi:hypothetical protein
MVDEADSFGGVDSLVLFQILSCGLHIASLDLLFVHEDIVVECDQNFRSRDTCNLGNGRYSCVARVLVRQDTAAHTHSFCRFGAGCCVDPTHSKLR